MGIDRYMWVRVLYACMLKWIAVYANAMSYIRYLPLVIASLNDLGVSGVFSCLPC